MAKPFKLSLVSDVRDFTRGMRSVEDELDSVASSLDDLTDAGKGAGAGIDKGLDRAEDALKDTATATDRLERKFSDAVKDMRRASKTAGDSIGENVKKGTDEAAEGVEELKDEAGQSAREMAASFSGEMEDVGDLIQEVAANAFVGFGPAGMAAGVAAAVGIGFIISKLQQAAEEAAESKQRVIELAGEIDEVGGDPEALDWAAKLRDILSEITDEKQWWEVWQDTPKTRLEEWSQAAEDYGLEVGQMARAVAGSTQDMADVQEVLTDRYDDLRESARRARAEADEHGQSASHVASSYDSAAEKVKALQDELNDLAGEAPEAAAMNDAIASAVAGISDAAHDAATATQNYESAVAASLDEAGSAWSQYVEDGTVNLASYNAAIEAQQQAVIDFENNLVTASQSLSNEALDYIRQLGPEAAPLLQAFVDAPMQEKERTAKNWDALGKATSDGYKQSLKLDDAVSGAVDKAQRTADGKHVKVKTDVDSSRLQSQLDNALARLRVNAVDVPVTIRRRVD